MKLVLFIVFLFFTSIGVIYFLNVLQYFLISNKNNKNEYRSLVLIPVSGHIENIELLARKYLAKYKINPYFKKTNIIFVDNGLDNETRQVFSKLQIQNHNFTLCNKFQVYALLGEIIK